MEKIITGMNRLSAGIISLLLAGVLFFGGALTSEASDVSATDTDDTAIHKIVFVGDSRSVDMFSGTIHEIKGKRKSGIYVYAKDAGNYDYLVWAVNKANMQAGDVLVTWMGCNDRGDFTKYKKYYNKLLKRGIRLIVGTVGFSDDNKLGDEGDVLYYNDTIMRKFNSALTNWAKKKGVKIIALYEYTKKHIKAQSHNGVHYIPKPTQKIWKYILKKVGKILLQT